MNILVIEDERIVSNDLSVTIKKILKEDFNIHQVYSVKESIIFLQSNEMPDLIFSDIQLGDGTCFEIFQQISIEAPIIFCTAYDEFALKAFKSNGIDYILKPFATSAIKEALNKFLNFRNHFNKQKKADYSDLLKIISELKKKNVPASILVYFQEKIIPIKTEDIALFYVDGDNTFLRTFSGIKYTPNKSLDDLEKICGDNFFRANRQFLVSRSAVQDAYSFFSRKLALTLNIPFEEKILISKEKKITFLHWLSNQ